MMYEAIVLVPIMTVRPLLEIREYAAFGYTSNTLVGLYVWVDESIKIGEK